MKLFSGLILFLMVVIGPFESATAIMISPISQGGQISAFDSAETAHYDGNWHMISHFGVISDAGFYGPGFAIFDLSSVTLPIDSLVLNLQVVRATALDGSTPELIPTRLYDVSDIGTLSPPPDWLSWDIDHYMDDFYEHKEDLTSGAVYGDLMIPNGTADLNYDITLTEAAVADINASLGGLFAIGFGPGPSGPDDSCFFPDEDGYVTFGNVQLSLTPVPEPCTFLLLGIGMPLVGILRRKKYYSSPKHN